MAENNPQIVVSNFTFKEFVISASAGGIAGASIDFALFPIDSIKTRLQASSNKTDFVKQAADISKFKGLASAMAASFPCAAVFWLSYEYSKFFLHNSLFNSFLNIHMQHLVASSLAEIA